MCQVSEGERDYLCVHRLRPAYVGGDCVLRGPRSGSLEPHLACSRTARACGGVVRMCTIEAWYV